MSFPPWTGKVAAMPAEYEVDPAWKVEPRRSPDEQAQSALHQIMSVMMMLEDMVQGGAVVKIHRPQALSSTVDHKDLFRRALISMIDRILSTAEVVDG